MLTIMCPNCRLRFPAPGCCGGGGLGGESVAGTTGGPTATGMGFGSGVGTTSATVSLDHLMSTSDGGGGGGGLLLVDASGGMGGQHRQQVTISTQCGIQSGGCLIQSSNAEVLLSSSSSFAPRLEVRSKLTGGGCLMEKRIEDHLLMHHQQQQQAGGDMQQQQQQQDQYRPLMLISEEQLRASLEQAAQFHRSHSTTARLDPPPSGCQELPGTRREGGGHGVVGGVAAAPTAKDNSSHHQSQQHQQQTNRHHHHLHHHHPPSSMCCGECRCCCYCHCCSTTGAGSGYAKRKQQQQQQATMATGTTSTTATMTTTTSSSSSNLAEDSLLGPATTTDCPRNLCQVASSSNSDGSALDHHRSSSRGLTRCCCRNNSGGDCKKMGGGGGGCPVEDRQTANVDGSPRGGGGVGEVDGLVGGGGASNYPGDVRIHVNATVHLPSTSSTTMGGSCTFNITASTSTSATDCCAAGGGGGSSGCGATRQQQNAGIFDLVGARSRNNFNGGGIVTGGISSGSTADVAAGVGNALQSATGTDGGSGVSGIRDDAPSTPVSWLTPCPWGFDVGYMPEKDVLKLTEVRRLLQTCGWYHEGLSWQQSENLLKNAPVGRWLMRDSSDSRYTFAISVQTARGPTSVRVFYFMGKFRLDAEPRLALAMPLFECPIKMLEYYCEYSKRMDEHRQEVWVDYSGQVYSQIYLSEPLLKEVRSLSHLARIAVNRGSGQLARDREGLPPVIKNYLNEYPYTL